MLDRELWLFINTFAEWFSALGTIAAVIVALHLARRDARITLKVAVGIRLMLQRGVEGRPEFFSLAVTNVGRRPARITGIAMRDGLNVGVKRFRVGSYMFMLPPQNALSADVPKTITDGETAHYLVAWPEFVRVNGDLIRGHFAGRLGAVGACRQPASTRESSREPLAQSVEHLTFNE